MTEKLGYKDAGVDISAGEESVKEIARLAKSTFSDAVLKDIGLFGSFFQIDKEKYRQPVLVSSVDGVGTKLKVAFMAHIYDTVGEDLVNHCVNDIMTSGADPLFFLDYLAFASLDSEILVKIIEGLARGCRNANCALIGGETAEMPGFYQPGEFDMSGTIVGIADRENVIDGGKIVSGDILVALPSNGLHTNGYSLVRKVFFELNNFGVDQFVPELQTTLGEELLRVHQCYQRAINAVKFKNYVHGMSHITGGGIEGNTKRLLSEKFRLKIDWDVWEAPPIFRMIQKLGNIETTEMRRVFNLGVGFIFVVDKNRASDAINDLRNAGEKPFIIGEIQ
ncbi:MAG: phosphoribosylformylglycinamidine cyclo-ligase [Calditrichaeota bacterium]|nr:phosphoribosylformylglycinamidine cyclo-ligase [Calditrichota bacterium]